MARFGERHVVSGDAIPTELLRDAFARSDRTANEVARALGWRDRHGYHDGDRVRRAIGAKREWIKGRDGGAARKHTARANAVALIVAMGFDPVDFGL